MTALRMQEFIEFLNSIKLQMKEEDANILQLHNTRNRKIYSMLKTCIMRNDVYKKLIKHDLVDTDLLNYWDKPGYEKLCCVSCIIPQNHEHDTVCKCRLPQKLKDDKFACVTCKCNGCASF